MAGGAKTRVSVSSWVQKADNVQNPFVAKIHTLPCTLGAGSVFQSPYECGLNGFPGCTQATVDSHFGPYPLEFSLEAHVNMKSIQVLFLV